jgi:prepilin-type N-terminal cleavage/methylation domain-containing protein
MMNTTFRRQLAKGFTLIELLIVVIIIAILAAIAIPQFSVSTEDAKVAALDANLSTVRSAIEMYRVQHKNTLPAKNKSTATTGCPTGGVAGNAAADTPAAFTDQLTGYSNADGQTCTVPDPLFPFGPYLRAIPAEPGSGLATVSVKNTAAAADNAGGWLFSTLTAKFQANNTKDKVGTAATPYSDR